MGHSFSLSPAQPWWKECMHRKWTLGRSSATVQEEHFWCWKVLALYDTKYNQTHTERIHQTHRCMDQKEERVAKANPVRSSWIVLRMSCVSCWYLMICLRSCRIKSAQYFNTLLEKKQNIAVQLLPTSSINACSSVSFLEMKDLMVPKVILRLFAKMRTTVIGGIRRLFSMPTKHRTHERVMAEKETWEATQNSQTLQNLLDFVPHIHFLLREVRQCLKKHVWILLTAQLHTLE